jgi:hypothetical protein
MKSRLRAALRPLVRTAVFLSLVLFVAAVIVRWRAEHVTDVWSVAGFGRCVLIKSNAGRWVEVNFVPRGWTDQGVGWWSFDPRNTGRAAYTKADGPATLALNYTRHERWLPRVVSGEYAYCTGEMAVMVAPDGKPEYDRTRDPGRAGAAWRWVRRDSPYWIWVPTTEVRAAHIGIAALAAVLPGAWGFAWTRAGVRAIRRRRAQRRGLCPRCGYDLRGSRGRCPECGEVFDPAGLRTVGSLDAKGAVA